MKILFALGTFFPSKTGGPATILYWHAKELSKNGIRSTVLTTNRGVVDQLYQDKTVKDNNLTIHYNKQTFLEYKTIFKAIKEVKNARIVHLNSIFEKISIFVFFFTKMFYPEKKIVWSVRGELSLEALKFSPKRKQLLINFYKILTKNISFHATSKKEYNEIKNFFPTAEVITIPNLIKSPERIHHPIQNDFLFVGRIHPIKGIDRLIEACAKSEKFLNSNYRLLIVGKAEKSQLTFYNNLLKIIEENHLQDKVIFLGHQDGKEKEKYYAQSKFLFLTSDSENFGNVVIEALNQGTPVVASLGTPWEILEEFKAGFHIQNSAEEIAKIFDKIIELPEQEYAAYRENAVKLVDQNYNIDSQFYKWIEAYQNVLK